MPTSTHKRKYATGFTLVELMVAITISMVVVIAASYIYLSTRDTQRSMTGKAFAFDSAKFALDLIGRDIENAGFYPAIRSSSGSSGGTAQVEGYANPITTNPPDAYNAVVFGCSNQRYRASTFNCVDHPAGIDADTLVINYYSNDASGLDIGNRADCERQDAANDVTTNAITGAVRRNALYESTKSADRPFLLPQRPLFVSNAYSLNTTEMKLEGSDIHTFSLSCLGNGVNPQENNYYPIVTGIEQLRFEYLVTTDATGKYFRTQDMTPVLWQSVAAIKVCLIARSMETTKIQGSTSFSITDCDGKSKTYTDGMSRRVFNQVFALKNQARRVIQ